MNMHTRPVIKYKPYRRSSSVHIPPGEAIEAYLRNGTWPAAAAALNRAYGTRWSHDVVRDRAIKEGFQIKHRRQINISDEIALEARLPHIARDAAAMFRVSSAAIFANRNQPYVVAARREMILQIRKQFPRLPTQAISEATGLSKETILAASRYGIGIRAARLIEVEERIIAVFLAALESVRMPATWFKTTTTSKVEAAKRIMVYRALFDPRHGFKNTEIARIVGKDHTTVWAARRRVAKLDAAK